MTKKVINQNDKFREDLINTIEPNFVFNNEPINRFINNDAKHADKHSKNKNELLLILKKQINSIENCKLKENSRSLILGIYQIIFLGLSHMKIKTILKH